jgi:hypothetical protein
MMKIGQRALLLQSDIGTSSSQWKTARTLLLVHQYCHDSVFKASHLPTESSHCR